MSKLKVFDMKGESVGDLNVADKLMVCDKGDHAVFESVIAYMAGRRAGTASTLHKGEVAGSNKKPWKQKGSGRARAGYRQSPVWRGGAAAFGPKPRSYAVKVNKKVAKLAFKRAFSGAVEEGKVRILDKLEVPEAKTKFIVELLKSLKISGPVLIVVDKIDSTLGLASRNIPNLEVVMAGDLNVYQLVRYPTIVISKAAIKIVEVRLGKIVKEKKAVEAEVTE